MLRASGGGLSATFRLESGIKGDTGAAGGKTQSSASSRFNRLACVGPDGRGHAFGVKVPVGERKAQCTESTLRPIHNARLVDVNFP